MVPGKELKHTLIKLAIEQTLFSPFIISCYFTSISLMEGVLPTQMMPKMKQALLANWSVWPFINFINYHFVPQSQRVLYTSTFAIVWNAYLSHLQHKQHEQHAIENDIKKRLIIELYFTTLA